jgi:hypothetical protein
MPINFTNHIQPSGQTILMVEDEFAAANDLPQVSSFSAFWSSDC